DPSYEAVRFFYGGAEGASDLYVPSGGGKYPAVVLFFGVIPAGRDDPRIVNLASGLARSGIVVLIPWSEVMTTFRRLDPKAVDLLVGAFQYLESHPAVDASRIGVAGFCVGASFAALAAEDDRIKEKVAYVNSFGGYYDAKDLLVAIASQTRFYDDFSEPWTPREDSKTVFAVHLLEGLPDAREGEMLAREFGYLKEPPAATYDPVSVSQEAQAVRSLLSGVTMQEAQALLSSLPSQFLDDLALISPSTRIGDLKAPVLIMHDSEDTAVPAAESRRMANALKERGQVHYTEFSLFQHVDPTRQLSPLDMAKEMWKLMFHMYMVMRLGT
ncbi:MAG: dienelactone hydrolase family protein, partial [Chloroflexota bacterium]